MLKIHKPYKYLVVGTSLFVSGALPVGYCNSSLGFGENTKTYAAEDFSTEYRTISDITYMQDMNQQICSNTDTPAPNSPASAYPTAILKDNRSAGYDTRTMTGSNGETHSLDEYVVVKLEDGNCWMQENLRLKAPAGGLDLTSIDSDVSNWHMPETLIGNSATKRISGWMDDNSKPYSAYLGDAKNGVYYNWTAAIAMDNSSSNTSGDVDTSICPLGWKLPKSGGDGGLFNILMTNADIYTALSGDDTTLRQQGSVKAQNLPYDFHYAGRTYNSYLDKETTYGYWWSSTAFSTSRAYNLRIDTNYASPNSNNDRSRGFSVRCVAAGGLEPNEAPTIPPSSKNGNITVNVTPTITLDVSEGVTATAEADKIATGTIEATIISNSDYDVLLSTTEPKLIGKENSKNYIPPTSDTNPVQPGNDAWGMLNVSGLYDAITNTPSPFHNTESTGNNAKTHTFTVGISISPSLPADTYATEVTVTAATK